MGAVTDKRTIYADMSVKHLWYVDPAARIVEVFRLSGKDWIASETYFHNDPVSAAPFDAITFPLGELWETPATPDNSSANN